MPGDGSNGSNSLSYCRSRWSLSFGRSQAGPRRGRAPGAKVDTFSPSSQQRMRRYLSRCAANYRYMGTLTVAGDDYQEPARFRRAVDRFLVGFLRMQERYCDLRSVSKQSIFWFVEFQKRGAPHLHFFYTYPIPWRAAAELWARACNREGLDGGREDFALRSTKFEKLRSGIRGAASYAAKYAAKMEQKEAPAWWSGRFWGVRGCRELGGCHKIMDDSRIRGPARAEFDKETDQAILQPLRDAERAGLVRGLSWQYGQGAIWWLVRGEWDDYPALLDALTKYERYLSAYEAACNDKMPGILPPKTAKPE